MVGLLAIDKAAIARSVKNLEEKGYMKTERSTKDKRAKELYLTASGKKFLSYTQTLHRKWSGHVTDGMEENEIETFIESIDRMSSRAKIF